MNLINDRQSSSSLGELRASRAAPWAALAFLLLAVPYLFPVFDAETLYWFADLWAPVALIGIVGVVLAIRIPGADSCRERWFWIALTVGFWCWFAGRLIWGVFYDSGLIIDLIADFLFTWLYVGCLVALELDPDRDNPSAFARRLRRYMIAGGAVLIVATFGYFVLIPARISPAAYESWKPAAIGSVLFDFYVAIRLYIRFRGSRTDRWRRIYGWMTASFVIWTATDVMHVFWLFHPVSALDVGTRIDLLWYVPYVLFAVGALVGRDTGAGRTAPVGASETLTMSGPLGGTPLMAYVFALALVHAVLDVTGVVDPLLRPARSLLIAVQTVVLAVLVFRTHHLILGENRRLRGEYERISRSLERANVGLEERVRQRTGELQEANRRLANDIEERIQVARRLRTAEARMRALIHAVPDALILVDFGGVVRDVFPGQSGITGLDLASSRGRLCVELFPQARSEVESAVAELRRGRACRAVPVATSGPEGDRHLELRFRPCGDDEILVLVQDVTERAEFEASLQQSQKLESLGVLAGGIAHDFNNLLVNIIGNAQLARMNLAAGEEPPLYLASIERNALRASKLTDNLLAYAGEVHVERVRLDLAQILVEMEPLLVAAARQQARFEFDVDGGAYWIDGNEAQLTQVALNLTRNAAEALGEASGTITVGLDRLRVGAGDLRGTVYGLSPAPGDYVRLQVRDTGCGIAPDALPRIFDPFFTSKGLGRGLGLAATLGIVNHHEAALTIESAPDQGTHFSLYFPAREEPASLRPAAAGRLRGSGALLVVDDEEDVRDLIVSYLRVIGFTTVEAANGTEAVEQVREHRGRLAGVILDFAMPDLNGAGAHGLIRALDPDLPIIMMSGYSQREALASLRNDERTGFVHKPFELRDFGEVLSKCLGLAAREAEA